jgi:Tfp pilus assembly protein PilN
MIHVNLLPRELRPVKRTPIPYIVSLAVVAAVLALAGYIYQSTDGLIGAEEATLAKNQGDLNALKAVVEDNVRLQTQKATLSSKIKTINEIVKARIIWSRQLFNISRILPENFWYEEISVETKRYTENVTRYDPKAKANVTKSEQVMRRVLQVKGYAIEGDEGGFDIYPLVSAAEEDGEFANMFELQPPTFGDTLFNDFPVKSFTLDFRITDGGATP